MSKVDSAQGLITGEKMQSLGQLWDKLGDLGDQEIHQLLTRLFTFYETELEKNPQSEEANHFFRILEVMLEQTSECNLNRR